MEFITKYWTQILFLGSTLLIVVKYIRTMNEATKCSLRNDMLAIYNNCKTMKQISRFDFQAFMYSYEAYKKLKGNSFINEICEIIKKYEIID